METLLFALPLAFSILIFTAAFIEEPARVIIHTVTVPEVLAERGYDAPVVASLINKKIENIVHVSDSYHHAKNIKVASKLDPIEQLAETLHLEEPVRALQELFGLTFLKVETHFLAGDGSQSYSIGGQLGLEKNTDSRFVINVEEHNELFLDLEFEHPRTLELVRAEEVKGNIEEPGKLIDWVAFHIVREVEPYIYASYLFQQESHSTSHILDAPQGDYVETQAFLESHVLDITEEEEEAPWYFNLLGLVYSRQGDQEKAMKSFKKALSIDSNFMLAKINLGWLLSQAGYYELAIQQFEEVQDGGHDMPINHLYWAATALRMGRLDLALAQIVELEQRTKEIADGYTLRALIYELMESRPDIVATNLRRAEIARWKVPRQVFFLAM